jgi:hypothetical protein
MNRNAFREELGIRHASGSRKHFLLLQAANTATANRWTQENATKCSAVWS